MSEFKGTPGPWVHRLDMDPPDPGIDADCGGCVAHVQCHANVNTVARTGEEFCHADARLIAAAPDLLAACEALPLDCEFEDAADFKDRSRAFLRAMELARAAIRKVEGA